MIFLPFIYFTLLTAFLAIKKKDFDVSVFMSGLFALTSFMSVVVVRSNLLGDAGILFTNDNLKLRLVPTLLYCILPTIAILPFAIIKTKNIKNMTLASDKVFMAFCICLLLVSVLNFYLPIDKLIDIFKNGTWLTKNYGENPSYTGLWEAKVKQSNGELMGYQIRLLRLPLIFGYVFYLSKSTILLLPCFFYSLCFLKKKMWFNILLLVGSASSLAISIQTSDRTEFINYALMFVVNLLLFKHLIKRKQWIVLSAVMIPITFVAVFYFVGVTKARFHTDDKGEIKGIVQYSGQSYLNFCYFYDNAKNEKPYFERMFPLTNHFILDKNYDNQTIKEQNKLNGFKTDVFTSFLGTFLLDLGKIPMILWTLMFFALCMLFLPPPNDSSMSFEVLMLLFALAAVPTFGVFYYRYLNFTHAMIPTIALGAALFSSIQIYLKKRLEK